MTDLDDLKAIKKLDKSNMVSSIEVLGKQIEQTWEELKYFEFPDEYREIENVVVNGMGGSGLGASIIKELYFDKLSIPVQSIHNYHLPAYANYRTLLIASSYSGGTEEILSATKEGLEKGCKIVGIATGGKLEKLCKERNLPFFKINPINNPCGQPRMGLGYSIFAQFGILMKAGLINIGRGDRDKIVYLLEENNQKYGLEVKSKENLAKQLAHEMKERMVVIVSSEFLFSVGYAMRNQINENSKNFGFIYEIPEANHHMLESFKFPTTNKKNRLFIFLNSEFYDENNRLRIESTKVILKQNKIKWIEFQPESESKLFQVFETLGFGTYLNFYLAMLNGIDPSPIPYVDFFKKDLVERRKS